MGLEAGDKRTISAEQVAILADRVDTLLNNYSRIEGILLSMGQQQSLLTQQLAVFQERLAQMGENQRRTNDVSDQTEERLEKNVRRLDLLSEKVTVHAWAWKLFGSVAVLSLGLVTWTFKELQANSKQIDSTVSAIRLLDYQVQQNSQARVMEQTIESHRNDPPQLPVPQQPRSKQ